jgi:predicted nucleic acid-binding protein
VTVVALLDLSGWARFEHPTLGQERRAEIADRLRSARLGVCLPFLCEAGYSARNAREYQETVDTLLALPFYGIDAEVEVRALDAQRQLARAGHHRLPFPDLLIAAIADRHRCAVLHYDTDFDLLRERTDLRFDSEWLAKRGSL